MAGFSGLGLGFCRITLLRGGHGSSTMERASLRLSASSLASMSPIRCASPAASAVFFAASAFAFDFAVDAASFSAWSAGSFFSFVPFAFGGLPLKARAACRPSSPMLRASVGRMTRLRRCARAYARASSWSSCLVRVVDPANRGLTRREEVVQHGAEVVHEVVVGLCGFSVERRQLRVALDAEAHLLGDRCQLLQ